MMNDAQRKDLRERIEDVVEPIIRHAETKYIEEGTVAFNVADAVLALLAESEPVRDEKAVIPWPEGCNHGVPIGWGPCLSCRLADLALAPQIAQIIVGPGHVPGHAAKRKMESVLSLLRGPDSTLRKERQSKRFLTPAEYREIIEAGDNSLDAEG